LNLAPAPNGSAKRARDSAEQCAGHGSIKHAAQGQDHGAHGCEDGDINDRPPLHRADNAQTEADAGPDNATGPGAGDATFPRRGHALVKDFESAAEGLPHASDF
jgi:hypothetical protein